MSVNLSVRQLQSETLIADVRQALEVSGLPAASLVLEITESLMLTDTDFAMMQLHELKALGIRLAMDDFGTGYSSLSYLSRFPVDILKMDRSFVGSEDNEHVDLGDHRARHEPVARGRRGRNRACRAGQLARRARLRVRAGISLRPSDGFGCVDEVPRALTARRLRKTSSRRQPRMQHSHDALDRPGGFGRGNLLSPLRHRDFRILWTGMTISLIGDGIFLIAIAWESYSLWNAPAALSIVGIGMTIPTIAFLLIGGVVSDRRDRRLVMAWADGSPRCRGWRPCRSHPHGRPPFWELVVLVAVYGVGTAFFMPAFEAILPDLLPEAGSAGRQCARPVRPAHRA